MVEDKNLRQWLYPQRPEVWQVIQKSLAADEAVPLLVTRKAPPTLVAFFGRIGGLAFQTNNQFFSADVAQDFELVIGKDGLNFFDIRFDSTQIEDYLARYLTNTVLRIASEKRAQFRAVAPILRRYAESAAKDGLSSSDYAVLLEELVQVESA